MCEAIEPLAWLRQLSNEVLSLHSVCKEGTQEKTILKLATRNLHSELRDVAMRLEQELDKGKS